MTRSAGLRRQSRSEIAPSSTLVFVRPVLVALSLVFALSAQAQDPAAFAANLRAGESINGFPNWAERVLLQWMNRARVDPQKELANCGAACGERACYRPMAPLVWSEQLNRSARFHADEMGRQGYFAHDSKCNVVTNINSLYPTACNGAANCACTSGAPTAWTGRVALFGAGASGEIIASGTDPDRAFYMWLYENAGAPTCGFGVGNGHRYLILASDGAVGVGMTSNAVGDFGGGATPYQIPSAAHYPRQAETVTIWANWYDKAAPNSANAIVDGKCTSLSLQRGTATNGAWSAEAKGVGSGCHRYYISFIDSTNHEITWPATGSLGIGGASCEDWNSSRTNGSCGTSSNPGTPVPPAKRRAVKRGH